MSDHTYEFTVTMTCGGCSGAVDRVLKKLDGVKTHEVTLGSTLGKPAEEGTVKVVAEPTLDYDTVLRTISKTGKKVNSGSADGQPQSIEVSA
ncbi:heavy-metal-associated domain-containing protein [Microdochium trichocladiopsis]|uniref:Heavy-metal-associated domain-containing protein n=1 Tax=Microdochium trichocladiopsis TaxID=1682393 RepID=A0A9P9BKJ1_9PEZI|nr:heavy-metal-associated domain-containing protein [Microdochium trichocladiopsis]KAH7021266.1 heavy-metal-associated domain-containing protein [Microdochium trichocladiopsis]